MSARRRILAIRRFWIVVLLYRAFVKAEVARIKERDAAAGVPIALVRVRVRGRVRVRVRVNAVGYALVEG